jgi:excisionase family DNA binding protein
LINGYGDILTLEDVCEILSIGKNTAYTMLNTKELQGFKIGHVWKIPKSSLESYITERCHPIKKPL